MDQLASRRYARAILQIALEKNELDQYYEQIAFARDAFNNNMDLMNVLRHPSIMPHEKMAALENIFKESVCEDILGLFSVVLKKNREDEILAIFDSFIKMADNHNRRVTAVVSSVVPLSEKQIDAIRMNLSKKLNKQVEVQSEIDPSLIGGLKIIVDGKVLDASIKSKIEAVEKELLKTQPV